MVRGGSRAPATVNYEVTGMPSFCTSGVPVTFHIHCKDDNGLYMDVKPRLQCKVEGARAANVT